MRFGDYSPGTVRLERTYHVLFGFTQGWCAATIVMGVILPPVWQKLVPVGMALLSTWAWRLVARRWKRAFQADIDSWDLNV